ncbi:MAG: nicotinate-nucleotide--dimethylbenzimidazole phosphoribosyltransferase [Verrucomicrobiota bacterium]
MVDDIREIIEAIQPVDGLLQPQIQQRLDDLTKPKGSLGRLEECAMRMALIQNTVNPQLTKKRFYVFAADHGVAEEGVSAYPSEITYQMVLNMLDGGAGINVLGRHADAEMYVVDVGVAADFTEAQIQKGLISRKVMRGSKNMVKEPAMDEEQMRQAFMTGVEMARRANDEGVQLLGTGEMGIANTTPSTALLAALLPCSVEEVTGKGTGLDKDGITHKVSVIKQAMQLHARVLQERDPFQILAAVGGLEIAAMVGMILAAASLRMGLVVDGFISSAAALVAYRTCPPVKDYIFFSHLSAECGHQVFLDKIEVEPLLDLGLCLGEGTGAALAMQIIQASMKLYQEMNTFSGAGIQQISEGV